MVQRTKTRPFRPRYICTQAFLILAALLCANISLSQNLEQTGTHTEPGQDPDQASEKDSPPIKPETQQRNPAQEHFSTAAEKAILNRLEQLEGEHNSYELSLSEVLEELADHYFKQKHYELAASSYRRAMHIQRINLGLYNGKQLKLSQRLLNSLVADNKWNAALKLQQYRHWLGQRHFQSEDREQLHHLQDIADWHIGAYIHTGQANNEHLYEAKKLYTQLLRLYDSGSPMDKASLVDGLKGIVATNYYIALAKQEQSRNRISFTADSNNVMQREKDELELMRISTYQHGKAAIQKMVEIYQGDDNDDQEDALILSQLALADWHLLFSKSHSARSLYKEAFNKASLPARKRLALFEQPVQIPVLPQRLNDFPKPEIRSYAVVQYDVHTNGSTRNIKVLETFPEANRTVHNRAKAAVRGKQYRPVIDDSGEFITAQDIKQRFSFP